MSGGKYNLELLRPSHEREAFRCGVPELDAYIAKQARQDNDRDLARVFILTEDGRTIAGFFTLSSSSMQGQDFPGHIQKKLPRFPIPVTLLGRMAVASGLHGQRLGELLLMGALEQTLLGSRTVASWGVIVDAKLGAREFYLRYSFLPFPTQPDCLYLPMREIEKLNL